VAAEYRALPGSRPAPTVAVQRPAAPEPESTEEAVEEEEQAEEIAAINELPTEVPGAPVLALPSTPARPVAVPGAPAPAVVLAPAPRPVITRPARPMAPVAAAPVALPAPARPAAAGTYTVAPRETLYSVARRFGVRPAELAAWNSLSPAAALQVGQVLRVGGSAAPLAPAASPAETYYAHTVAVGDTFFNISRRYGCSVAELQASNSRAEPSLRVGEVLRVPVH
jgi:membrane-bound lytic murein transglycosylase D